MSDRFKNTPVSTLLRRVARARAAGDWRAASEEWHACVVRARPRVENVVDRYYFGDEDVDDVVQEVLIRAMRRLVENLDDLAHEGVFFAAIIEVAKKQCLDSNRAFKTRQARVAGSLDEQVAGEEGRIGRFDREQAAAASAHHLRSEDVADAFRRVDAALPLLKDKRAQKILTYDRLGGVDDATIASELGISVANVYTIRSRALRELRGLIDR